MLELEPNYISKQLLDLKNLKPIIFSFTPTEVLAFLNVLDDACRQHLASNEEDCRNYSQRVELIKRRLLAFSAMHTAPHTSNVPTASTHDTKQCKKTYAYEVKGEKKMWSGRGRMPKLIKEAIASGRSLKDFEIY